MTSQPNDCAWDSLAQNVVWDSQIKTWDDFGIWYIWGQDKPMIDGWIPDAPISDGWVPELPPANTWTPEGPLVPC